MITIFCSISKNEVKKVESWLIPSLQKQKNITSIELYLINYTGKGKLYTGKAELGIVKITEIKSEKSLGFGEAHNFAFNEITPKDYFLIINPDVYLHEDCIHEMIREITSEEKIGIVEARQLPFEHPKEYDRETGDTPWASGFGIIVKSDLFKRIRGFDENFWMYCEDVDLSWRTWLAGYRVVYCPSAIAYHFTGAFFEYVSGRFYIEQFWSARNFLYLAHKYWGGTGERKAKRLLKGANYPAYFKKEILDSFEGLKDITDTRFRSQFKGELKKLKKKIKITGFNQYHETR